MVSADVDQIARGAARTVATAIRTLIDERDLTLGIVACLQAMARVRTGIRLSIASAESVPRLEAIRASP